MAEPYDRDGIVEQLSCIEIGSLHVGAYRVTPPGAITASPVQFHLIAGNMLICALPEKIVRMLGDNLDAITTFQARASAGDSRVFVEHGYDTGAVISVLGAAKAADDEVRSRIVIVHGDSVLAVMGLGEANFVTMLYDQLKADGMLIEDGA